MQDHGDRDGDPYVINGPKTFITNGQAADLVIVVAPTRGQAATAVADRGRDRGRRRFGADATSTRSGCTRQTRQSCSSTSPRAAENLLGPGGPGLRATDAATAAGAAVARGRRGGLDRARGEKTVDYTKERNAFGKPLIEFQNTAFKLAELQDRGEIGRVFVDWCVERLVAGDLDTVTASMAKYWCTRNRSRPPTNACSCTAATATCRNTRSADVHRFPHPAIYGGTNEIMKVLIARSL